MRAVLERLELPGVIDVHTHFMPRSVMDKVWAYFDAVGPMTGVEWPITYRMDEDARVEQLRALGVERFTSMIYAHKPGMAAWLNSWAAEFSARTPECLHTATIFPEPDVASYLTRALDEGAQVLKVHIQVGAFDPNDPLLDAAWGLLNDSLTPIVIHCGSGPVPGEFTGPDRIASLLRRFPRLRLVIAHMGLPEYGEFFDLASAYEGVHLDTTMAFTDFTEAMHPFPRSLTPRLVELSDRIVFGSDFPNIPYSYQEAVTALERLDLGDAWMRGVLRENALRLFDL